MEDVFFHAHLRAPCDLAALCVTLPPFGLFADFVLTLSNSVVMLIGSSALFRCLVKKSKTCTKLGGKAAAKYREWKEKKAKAEAEADAAAERMANRQKIYPVNDDGSKEGEQKEVSV